MVCHTALETNRKENVEGFAGDKVPLLMSQEALIALHACLDARSSLSCNFPVSTITFACDVSGDTISPVKCFHVFLSSKSCEGGGGTVLFHIHNV